MTNAQFGMKFGFCGFGLIVSGFLLITFQTVKKLFSKALNKTAKRLPNQSLNQTGKTMRFCVKFSAGVKARLPAG